jgi:hypothetical protein
MTNTVNIVFNFSRYSPNLVRSLRFMDAYRRGLTGRQAAWAAKKYRGHHVLPDSILEEFEIAHPFEFLRLPSLVSMPQIKYFTIIPSHITYWLL